ncbi:MAG TPA: hypothetical protein VF306_17225 [Pirellulales bacterium]
MNDNLGALAITAVTLGFLHTLCGPDHYLPFVAMSRAGGWGLRKTTVITLLCGLGHVASSVVLGFVGIAFGVLLFKLESIEESRGNVAAWLLIAFGWSYFVWGVVQALRNRPHTHLHVHPDGTVHAHEHTHQAEHLHAHAAREPVADAAAHSITPWVLLTIFLFGPCEPLIPMVMYPAAQANYWGVVWVALLFGLATLTTMTGMVILIYRGVGALRLSGMQRYHHALAGLIVLSCGVAIKLLPPLPA